MLEIIKKSILLFLIITLLSSCGQNIYDTNNYVIIIENNSTDNDVTVFIDESKACSLTNQSPKNSYKYLSTKNHLKVGWVFKGTHYGIELQELSNSIMISILPDGKEYNLYNLDL